MSRETVRQAFKTAISTVYSGKVYATRLNDQRSDAEFVCVYVSEGDIAHNFGGTESEMRLHVKHAKQNATDGALDTTMEALNAAIVSHASVVAAVKHARLESFEYDEESNDIPSLTYSYKVLF